MGFKSSVLHILNFWNQKKGLMLKVIEIKFTDNIQVKTFIQ